jgi:hypothetical protein
LESLLETLVILVELDGKLLFHKTLHFFDIWRVLHHFFVQYIFIFRFLNADSADKIRVFFPKPIINESFLKSSKLFRQMQSLLRHRHFQNLHNVLNQRQQDAKQLVSIL